MSELGDKPSDEWWTALAWRPCTFASTGLRSSAGSWKLGTDGLGLERHTVSGSASIAYRVSVHGLATSDSAEERKDLVAAAHRTVDVCASGRWVGMVASRPVLLVSLAGDRLAGILKGERPRKRSLLDFSRCISHTCDYD